jgi:carbon starvation protein
VFSSDPKLGFFAQRDRYADALEQGELPAPAKTPEQMQAVITNSTVDGVLAAAFALLVIIVILDAVRVWRKVLRDGTRHSTESPYVPSDLSLSRS